MLKQLKNLRNGYFAGVIALIFLQFAGYGSLWLMIPFTFIALIIALYVIFSKVTCPYCGQQLLTRAAIKSPDKCISCGSDLNGPKPSKRDIANDLMDKYGDERAAKTQWTPLNSPSANFDTHKLRISKNGQHTFKPTWGVLWFGLTFVIMGLISYTIVYLVVPYGEWFSLLPLLFVIVGLFELKNSWIPIRVNTGSGKFVLGWGKDDFVHLEEITSLQLLPTRSSGARFENYQLNLILADGSRKNIVSYYGRDKAVLAAQQLAEHLGISLWSGIDRDT